MTPSRDEHTAPNDHTRPDDVDQHQDSLRDQREAMRSLAHQHDAIVWGDDPHAARSVPAARGGIPGGSILAGDVGAKHEIARSMRALSVDQRRTGQRVRRGSSIPQAGLMIGAAVLTIVLSALAVLALLVWLVS